MTDTFFDARLVEVANVLRPEVPVPTILVTPDPVGPTRTRELQGVGMDVRHASRLAPILSGRILPGDLAGLQRQGAVLEAWYDAPQYAGYPAWLGARSLGPLTTGTVVKGLDDVRAFTHSDELANAGAEGKGVLVAVCDTGLDDSHPMLEGQVVDHLMFTGEPPGAPDQGHGTWCGSAIAGLPVEYQGKVTELRGHILQGMAPKAQLLDCRVLDKDGTGATSQIIQGIEAAVMRGARVVSLSLGSLFGGAGRTPDATVVNEAAKRGVACVIAAGNSFGYLTVGSPGSAAGAITVGAVAMEVPTPDTVATFSSKGPTSDGRIKPDIAAPGGNFLAGLASETLLGATSGAIAQESGEEYGLLAGTSMATPTVAGIIAQVVPLGFPSDRDAVEGVLAVSGRGRFGPAVKNNRTGWGVLDAQRLVQALQHSVPLPTRGWVSLQTARARPVAGVVAGLVARAQNLPVAPHTTRLRLPIQ